MTADSSRTAGASTQGRMFPGMHDDSFDIESVKLDGGEHSDDRPLGRDDRIKFDMDPEDALRSMLRTPPSHDDPE